MVESESKEGERFGYEMIGRAMAAWCKLDQELRRWTLLSNDPQGSSSFLIGKLEDKLERRIEAWFGIASAGCDAGVRSALTEYREFLVDLIPRRNDLAHSVDSVFGYHPSMFSVRILRISGDWSSKFAKWMRQLRSGHRRPMPEASQVDFRVYDRHLIQLSSVVEEAARFVRSASEARRAGQSFAIPNVIEVEWWGP